MARQAKGKTQRVGVVCRGEDSELSPKNHEKTIEKVSAKTTQIKNVKKYLSSG